MSSLLNKKAIKAHILHRCETKRQGWDCRRVSEKAIIEIEAFLRTKIDESVHRHPTIGKTFMHFD